MMIDIKKIEGIVLLLLAKFRESQGDILELQNDFYWDISSDELYNPYQPPQNITLGQISDDLNEISRLIKSEDAIPYDLKRIASILRALSDENEIAF